MYLLVLDSTAAIGLWLQKRWGVVIFLVVAASQLVAYGVFRAIFGPQTPLIVFHLLTLFGYVYVAARRRKAMTPP